MRRVLVWGLVAAAVCGGLAPVEAQRRENPGHIKQMRHLREENERLSEELAALKASWEAEGPKMVEQQARAAEAAAEKARAEAATAEALAEASRLKSAQAAEQARKLEAEKQVWELSVQRDEQQRLAQEAAARKAEADAEAQLRALEVASAQAKAAEAEHARAENERLTAAAETARWQEIRLAAEANATSARSEADATEAELKRLAEQRALAEVAAEQAKAAKDVAALELQKQQLQAAQAEGRQLLEQAQAQERVMKLELEKATREEAAAREATTQAALRAKEAEAKQWAAQTELDTAAARAAEAEAVAATASAQAEKARADANAEQARAEAAKALAAQAEAGAELARQNAEEAAEDRRLGEQQLQQAELKLKLAEEARREAEAVAAAKASEAEAMALQGEHLAQQLEIAVTEAKAASDRRLAEEAHRHAAQAQALETVERAQAEQAVAEAQARAAEARQAVAAAQVEADRLRAEQELAVIERQRQRDEALIAKQEESTMRVEAARIAKEMEREKAKVEAEAEGRIKQERENEDVKRRLLAVEAEAEKAKWMAAITAVTTAVGDGAHSMVTNHLERLVFALMALALGVYLAREGVAFVRMELHRWLGQPRLVRETSKRGAVATWASRLWGCATCRCLRRRAKVDGFADVVLQPSLDQAVRSLARSAQNAKRNRAPLRHAMFYGPPGTGKTMLAIRLARHTGLDYAIISGGDVAPLGDAAVAEMHKLFEWAQRSSKGVLLFIDEAEAFLGIRSQHTSETLRNVLSALLYHTGTQSHKFMMVLATNRPEDLDSAVTDRVDESLLFPCPALEERSRLVTQYFTKYILSRGILEDDFDTLPAGSEHTKVGQASNQRHDKSPNGASPGAGVGAGGAATPSGGASDMVKGGDADDDDSLPAASGGGGGGGSGGGAAPAQPLLRRNRRSGWCSFARCGCCQGVPPIHILSDVDEDLLREAAEVTEGFSGRAISKLMLAVQGAVYGRETMVLDAPLFKQVLDAHVARHSIKTKAWAVSSSCATTAGLS